jgi:outer membrane protein OmpA-like peptidoglycan-associated protein
LATRKIPLRQLINKAIDVPTGDPLTIVADGLDAAVIEMEDAHFHFDSAVMLPVPPSAEGDGDDADAITGIAVLATCLQFIADNPSSKLLVAGHTDTSGDAGYNLALSKLRADNVLHALVGNREEWTKVSDKKHQVRDVQLILKWAADEFDYPCDPGAVDGIEGPKTVQGIRAFQETYNEEFEESIKVDGVLGLETWGAIFDLYMYELSDLMETDEDGLTEQQGKVKFVNDAHKSVGCGETHPIEERDNPDVRSATNRRVELLFFEPGHEPKLPCHPDVKQCIPGLCEIYTLKLFTFDFIPVEPPKGTLKINLFDDQRQHMADAPYRLRIGGEEREGTSDGSGLVTEANVALVGTCHLDWGAPGPDDKEEFRFSKDLHVRVRPPGPTHQNLQAHRRLQNLGYDGGIHRMATGFQLDYEKTVAPWFDDPTLQDIIDVHDTGVDGPKPDDDSAPIAAVATIRKRSAGTDVA